MTYDRAGNRLTDTISGNGSFIRNVITENNNYRYYIDPNGLGNIAQKTNKQTGEINIKDGLIPVICTLQLLEVRSPFTY